MEIEKGKTPAALGKPAQPIVSSSTAPSTKKSYPSTKRDVKTRPFPPNWPFIPTEAIISAPDQTHLSSNTSAGRASGTTVISKNTAGTESTVVGSVRVSIINVI